jgi:hypothetical protein
VINCPGTCAQSYPSGTVVTLTATPAVGSSFTGWSGGSPACSGTGTCAVTMNSAQNVTATFSLPSFNLTVTKSGPGAGTVTSAPAGINCGVACTAPFSSGTVVTLTATPTGGSTFTGWSGGGCSGTGTCVVTLSAATTVNAQFGTLDQVLNVSVAGAGTGSVTSAPAGINCPGTCSGSFPPGTVVTLTAAPAAGSTFGGWSGGGCSGTGTCVVTTNAPIAVTATFNVAPAVLASALSRKVQGAAGTFDLPLSLLTTNPTTEPRQGPAQTIVLTFSKAITAANVAITEGTASAGAPTFSANSVIVGLTGVTDQQYVTVALTNVASADGSTGGSGSVRIGFLVGDVNQTRVVSVADLGLVNAQLSQAVTATNFLYDVNASGAVSVSDKGITNANLTKALPPP